MHAVAVAALARVFRWQLASHLIDRAAVEARVRGAPSYRLVNGAI